MSLKWGIVSCGNIAHDFVSALSTWPEGEHSVVSVAARNVDKAKQFAEQFDIPQYYGSYLELAKDPKVEIAYIASLTTQHYELGMLMLEHGKHVLCEKNMCMNEKQAKKLIEFAKSKNLFLMEALWSRFIPTYQYVKKRIDENALGEIKEVKCQILLPMHTNQKLLSNELAGGTIHVIGIYPIQAALWAFREYPEKITVTGEINENGVDLKMKGELIFSGGRKAFIETSFFEEGINDYTITGTKGRIHVHAPCWGPTHLTDVDGNVKSWQFPEAIYDFIYPGSCGLRYQQAEVKKAIRAGLIETEDVSHETSLQLHRIEDEIRRQLGVRFKADDEDY